MVTTNPSNLVLRVNNPTCENIIFTVYNEDTAALVVVLLVDCCVGWRAVERTGASEGCAVCAALQNCSCVWDSVQRRAAVGCNCSSERWSRPGMGRARSSSSRRQHQVQPDNPVRPALTAASHGTVRRLCSHESGPRGCSPPALSRLRPAASALHHAGHCTHNKHLNIILLWLHLVYKKNKPLVWYL